jgi:hypothetical protein
VAPARKVATKAVPMEVAQLADEGGFIGGVALTMCAITLLVSPRTPPVDAAAACNVA